MKRIFGVALLVLPLLAGSAQATNGWPFNVQAGGSFYIKGGPGPAWPQAGPWYLYWPLEAHFVAPAPTGYPYWPPPQAAPKLPPPVIPPNYTSAPLPPKPPVAATRPAPVTLPPVRTKPAAAPAAPRTKPPASPAQPAAPPQLQLPPYLQPTSYYPTVPTGQPPSYWYDQ